MRITFQIMIPPNEYIIKYVKFIFSAPATRDIYVLVIGRSRLKKIAGLLYLFNIIFSILKLFFALDDFE